VFRDEIDTEKRSHACHALGCDMMVSLGLSVWGSEFRVQGVGFKFQGSGFRVQGSGVRGQGARCIVETEVSSSSSLILSSLELSDTKVYEP